MTTEAGKNQATIDGSLVDFTAYQSVTKIDSTNFLFSGQGGSNSNLNLINFSLKAANQKGLKVGVYSSGDSSNTRSLSFSVVVGGERYRTSTFGVITITKLDTVFAGSYNTTIVDSSSNKKTINGNFYSRL